MRLDFTYGKYVELIDAIAGSDYQVLNISRYLSGEPLPPKFIIIRHDVDIDPFYQVRFAQLEKSKGISTSYYFRYVDSIFKEDVIDSIAALGHEVGYHYEVFTKTKGDAAGAIRLFREELEIFRKRWNSGTVCPHGGSFLEGVDGYDLKNVVKLIPKLLSRKSVFTSWSNFDLWKNNKVEDFGLLGDAYDSIDFTEILYLSDTGRSWGSRYKRLDKVNSRINPTFNIRKSDDIIRIIRKGEADRIYLLIHFEQWKDNFFSWVSWYIAQLIRRNGKKFIFSRKKK
jgi:hypothetical protein